MISIHYERVFNKKRYPGFYILLFEWNFALIMGLLSHEKNFGIYADVYLRQLELVLSNEIVPQEWIPRLISGSSLHVKRAIAFAPQFQFFDPVSQHECDLPICIKCSSKMKVATRWRLDRFCHVPGDPRDVDVPEVPVVPGDPRDHRDHRDVSP